MMPPGNVCMDSELQEQDAMNNNDPLTGNHRPARQSTVTRSVGFVLVFTSIIAFLVDRFTHVLSDILGKSICHEQYMQPVGGVVGDMSCGFNMDMYLAAGLFLLCLAGVVLIFVSCRKKTTS